MSKSHLEEESTMLAGLGIVIVFGFLVYFAGAIFVSLGNFLIYYLTSWDYEEFEPVERGTKYHKGYLLVGYGYVSYGLRDIPIDCYQVEKVTRKGHIIHKLYRRPVPSQLTKYFSEKQIKRMDKFSLEY